MKVKIEDLKVIDEHDWNEAVKAVYGKPYQFQQQYGCQDRGCFRITIPSENNYEEEHEMHDEIPEEVNGEIMGVKFSKWLERDPKQPIKNQEYDWELNMFWERNFYPSIYTVANDMYKKGFIDKGKYLIHIDW